MHLQISQPKIPNVVVDIKPEKENIVGNKERTDYCGLCNSKQAKKINVVNNSLDHIKTN